MDALAAVNAQQRKAPREEVPWALIGLRGCLALLVIFDHGMSRLDPKFDMVKIFGFDVAARVYCHRAIILFFSLSAYQLTIKFLKECPAPDLTAATNKEMVIMWGKYALRRFFRIYPGFAFALGLLTIWQPFNACYWDISSTSWRDFFEHLALQNLGGIFWTVPPELQYYLVIPIFVMAYKAAESADLSISRHSSSISGQSSSSAVASFPLRCSIRVLVLIPGCLTAWRMRLSPFGPNDLCMLDPYFFTFYLGSLAAVLDYTAQKAVADKPSGFTPYAYLLYILERWPVFRWSVRLAVAALTWLLFFVALDIPSLVSTVHPEEGHVTYYWFPRPSDERYVVVCTLLVLVGGMCQDTMPGEILSFTIRHCGEFGCLPLCLKT